jgi:hypothetical protein
VIEAIMSHIRSRIGVKLTHCPISISPDQFKLASEHFRQERSFLDAPLGPRDFRRCLMNAVVRQLGHVFLRVGEVVAGIFLIGCPVAIFAFFGFFVGMTNLTEAIAVGFVCIVMAGLSWVAGRAMNYILAGT